jgi:calcium-dependent protein kinase
MGVYNCFYCRNPIITQSNVKVNDKNNIYSPNEASYVSNSMTGAQNSLKVKHIQQNPSLKFDKSNFIRMKTKSLFDEYEIKEKLGEGAYGAVYKVQQRTTLFLRAVKAIKRKHVDSTSFSNEIAVLKTVDYPNIIKLFDCYYDNNYYYMVEEYCSGGDLFDYIQKQHSFSERKAAIIFKQLISAVNHLHKKKIVHRDLKPENIVFIKTNKKDDIFIKIIDFGTSVSIKHGHLTQELGTIYYIAPEVFKNKYNEKADVWSCGIILYTMLCGHPPFMGNKEDTIKNKILNSQLTFPEKEFKNVSKEAIEYIKQLLEYNPDNRLSAESALENNWLKTMSEKTSDDVILSGDIITNLSKFNSIVSLQKATLAFLANQISINQEIQKLKDEFDKIDENKDGEISKNELVKCLETMYPYGEAIKKANEIFAEIDFNNDGSISFSEFLTVNMKKEKLLNEDMLTKAFKLFDIDGNGYITINELKETMPLQITNNQQWIDLVKEVDQDGDCQISFNEFKDMMEKISNIKQ